MLSRLKSYTEARRIYSFGKITSKIESYRYELAFHEEKIVVATQKQLDVNIWVRVYGTFSSGVLRATFIGKLNGVDIGLFEKAINYIESHL